MFNIPDTSKQFNKARLGPGEGVPAGGSPGGGPAGEARRDEATLSKAHIRPRVEYVRCASYLRTTKGEQLEVTSRGKRGVINGFSRAARRRLLYMIAHIRTDAALPCFVTLTYPNDFPTVEEAKRDLKVFLQRLARRFRGAGWIWKLEPQERGAPHYHLLVWGVSEEQLLSWVVDVWYEIAGRGDPNHRLFHLGKLHDSRPCVSSVRSWRGVWSYASKYLGKTFEVAEWGKKWTGRFWGVGQRDNIPFGEAVEVEVPSQYVARIMRYQRRFSRNKRGNLPSLTTLCDVDHWVAQLSKERLLNNPSPCQREVSSTTFERIVITDLDRWLCEGFRLDQVPLPD